MTGVIASFLAEGQEPGRVMIGVNGLQEFHSTSGARKETGGT